MLFSIFKLLTGLGVMAGIIGAASLLTTNETLPILLATYIGIWWGNSVLEHKSWVLFSSRKIQNRVLSGVVLMTLIVGAREAYNEQQLIILSYLLLTTVVVGCIWFNTVEENDPSKADMIH